MSARTFVTTSKDEELTKLREETAVLKHALYVIEKLEQENADLKEKLLAYELHPDIAAKAFYEYYADELSAVKNE